MTSTADQPEILGGGSSPGDTAPTTGASNTGNGEGEGAATSGFAASGGTSFECNICLETARDAVVSMCGHLFCWPCLHRWMETRPLCPVCKAAISRDKVIPLYGRDSTDRRDPRDKVPPRPAGQRSEPDNRNSGGLGGLFGGFGGGGGGDGGFQMSFGIGAFPFGLFATTFDLGGGGGTAAGAATGENGGQQNQQQQVANPDAEFMSKLFLGIAILCIAWLLLA